METGSNLVLALAAISAEARAMASAALDSDLTEARFCADRVASGAEELGVEAVTAAAARVRLLLGEPGDGPRPGIGAAMLQLSDANGKALQ